VAGTVTGGLGANGGGNGQAFGGGLFLQGNETITLAPAVNTVETISGVVADQTGSGGTGTHAGAGRLVIGGAGTVDLTAANTYAGGTTISAGALQIGAGGSTGSIVGNVVDNGRLAFDRSNNVTFAGVVSGTGSLTQLGAGTLDLTAANTYAGGTTINDGVLELANAKAAGNGAIHFASTSGEVEYAIAAVGGVGPNLANTISGFGVGDAIDFSKVTWAAGDRAVDTSGHVGIETSAGTTVASFQLSVGFSGNLSVGPDGSGDVKVTDPTSAAGFALASPSSVSSVSDLLGQYGSELAAESSFPDNDTLGFDAWTALSPSAGVDPHGFHLHPGANLGRSALDLGAANGTTDLFGRAPTDRWARLMT
jgi:autotransporter-associated beta strand protein